MNRFIAPLIACIQIFVSGCIHTTPSESKTVELPANPAFTKQAFGDLVTESIVYLPSKLPLSDFFRRLGHGEFVGAFKRMDLNYRGSNADNEALRKISASGFIPVYVQIKNSGLTSQNISEQNFTMENGTTKIAAINAGEVPREFRKWNPGAVAADAFNVGIVVVGFAAVIVVLAAASYSCHGCDLTGLGNVPESSDYSEAPKMFNPVMKTTKIDYQSYLLSQTQINPGEMAKGLLLFHFKSRVGLQDYKLMLSK